MSALGSVALTLGALLAAVVILWRMIRANTEMIAYLSRTMPSDVRLRFEELEARMDELD